MDVQHGLREATGHSEEFYQAIVEESPNPAWIYDAESLAFLWVNAAAVAAYGYTAEEFASMSIADIRPEVDVASLSAHLVALGSESDPGRIWRHRTKGGAIRDVEVAGGALQYRGRAARYAIIRDVTRLVAARRDLELRARRLGALHRIDRGIIEAASTTDIARAALAHVRELLACERVSLMLIDPGGESAHIFLLEQADPASVAEGESFALGPYAEVLATLRSEGFYGRENLSAEPDLPPILAQLRDAGLRSIASLPLLREGELLGSLALYSQQEGVFGAHEVEIIKEVADQLAIAISQADLRERERRGAAERSRLLSNLVRAQEEERRRIAADLHDDVIQKIAALGMRLDIALRRHPELAEDPQFDRLQRVTAESIGALRTAMFRLRPPMLAHEALGETLRSYLAEEIGDAPIAYSLEDPCEGSLDDPVRETLFRIAQEAIVNALRHAKPSSIRVGLLEAAGGCLLRVTDDGTGWDAGSRPESPKGHLGLTAMRERAESLGGWLRVQSARGAGTTVECFAPFLARPDEPPDHPARARADTGRA